MRKVIPCTFVNAHFSPYGSADTDSFQVGRTHLCVWGMMSQGMVGISLDELCLGAVCKYPVEDRRGMLLLGANASITSDVVRNLRDREILQIRIDVRDVDAICVDDAEPIALNPENERKERIAKATPVKDLLIDCHDQGLSEARSQQLDEVMVLARRILRCCESSSMRTWFSALTASSRSPTTMPAH